MSAPEGITPDVVAAVLRRAAEIEAGRSGDAPALDISAVADVGRELGLSPDAVERATQEWRRGELARVEEHGSDRRLGVEALVVVQRQLPVAPADARRRTEAWLDVQHMERRRHTAASSEWAPKHGPMAALRRVMTPSRGPRLPEVDRVRLIVTPAGASETRVRVEAGLGSARKGLLGTLVALPLLLGLGGGVAAVAVEPGWIEAGAPIAGASLALAGYPAARSSMRKRRDQVSDAVHGALDDVTTGEALAPVDGVDQIIAAATKRALDRATRSSRSWVGRTVRPMPQPWTVLPPAAPTSPPMPAPPQPPGAPPWAEEA
ncbi:MAG TPA: hypothetical protein VHE83_09330 [Mycobacteriales bacterium]|nr:hypothetical protein [Mycobacteriales bacterium]